MRASTYVANELHAELLNLWKIKNIIHNLL